jgi:hypothetical protein
VRLREGRMHVCVRVWADSHSNNALEFTRRHLDGGLVVSVWDAEVLRVNVHQLHLVLRDTVRVWALESEGDSIRRVGLGL